MKYLGVLLAVILIVAWVPGSAPAQGLLPAGLGLPSFGGMLGGGGCAPACEPKAGGGLNFLVGYLATSRSVAIDFSSEIFGLGGVQNFRQRYGLDGIWLALLANGQVADGAGVYARGSWLVPFSRQSDEEYNVGAFNNDAFRNWSTSVQWWNADAGLTFNPYGALTVIGGFRFDSFATNFSNPQDIVNIVGLRTDDADMTVTSYIPYVGAMVSQGSTLKMGFIGFPYVPGSIQYNQTIGGGPARFEASGSFRDSYFLEAFAEYGLQLSGASVGIFGIWTLLHAASNVDLSAQPFTATIAPFQVTFDRQNWIFGGKFGINFVSPL